MRDPTSLGEWQEAANMAAFWILFNSAQKYGLVTGPTVNLERAEEIVKCAKRFGIVPSDNQTLANRYLKKSRC